MAIIPRSIEEGLEEFAQKKLSTKVFEQMQKEFKHKGDTVLNEGIIKKYLKNNGILDTSEMTDYIKKTGGAFEEALNRIEMPEPPKGPRPKERAVTARNKQGEATQWESDKKLKARQDKYDQDLEAYNQAFEKYDAEVQNIYDQVKRSEGYHSSNPDVWSMSGENIPSDDIIFPRKKASTVINNAESKINDIGSYELMAPDDIVRLNRQNQEIKSKAQRQAQANAANARKEKIRRNNIEQEIERANKRQRQAEVEYENKGVIRKKISDIRGNSPIQVDDNGRIINQRASKNTSKEEFSRLQQAYIAGTLSEKPTYQNLVDNWGNRFDMYGDVYNKASNPAKGFFQGLGYDGIGDFAKNNQLIVAGAIAGTGIGVAGIASAIGNANSNRGY